MKIKIDDITEGKLTPEQTAELQHYFKEGGTWQTLLDLKNDEIEMMYVTGCQLYRNGELEKASACFTALTQLNPYNATYWVALGAASQQRKAYEDALACYELALHLDTTYSAAHFYSAQCTYALGRKSESRAFLETVIASAGEFREKALEILILLKREGA